MSTAASPMSQYWALTKPRVVALIVFTAIIGMLLAIQPGDAWPWLRLVVGSIGIWLAAASAAAINHLLDQRIDKVMARTADRPLATGALKPTQVLVFAIVLGVASMLLLVLLLAQVGLGIANVMLSLPLSVAVLHNAGATALLFVLVTLLARIQLPKA